MGQLETEIIKQFADRLAAGLQTTFDQSSTANVVTLTPAAFDLVIYIYLPDAKQRCEQQHLRAIHIDYDVLLADTEKIYARLLSLFGHGIIIYARKTVVARVDKRVSLDFIAEHHLQAPIPGKYRYGLFYDGELVSIALFSGGRHMRDQHADYRSFELLRFCHKSGYRVVGGLSKLLKAFTQDFHPDDIMTYVDRDWAQDSNLRTLGFEEKGLLPPQSYWITAGKRHVFKDAATLGNLRRDYPNGYLSYNSGSTKLLLTL